MTAVKSEPNTSNANNIKPSNSTTTPNNQSRPGPKPGTSTRGRGASSYGTRGGARQQIMPRLQLLDDEDDGVTCRMCLQPFWYKSQLHDHLKSTHSITDPERYEKEEREKKLRRLREEQHRMALAQRGRGGGPGGPMIRGRGGTMIRGGMIRGKNYDYLGIGINNFILILYICRYFSTILIQMIIFFQAGEE